jgi:XTP/dITP diphosphohydrolase
MKTLVLATANQDKAREFRQIMALPEFKILTMSEAGCRLEIEENGTSYAENALIKARAVHRRLGGIVVADDSGLSVDVLDGAPGIHSARFAGTASTYADKIACLYAWLQPWPPLSWQAAFICVLALIWPDGREETFSGVLRGQIAAAPRGSNGFGYDPIFQLPDGRTMAELSDAEKNTISHRGQALRLLAERLLDQP